MSIRHAVQVRDLNEAAMHPTQAQSRLENAPRRRPNIVAHEKSRSLTAQACENPCSKKSANIDDSHCSGGEMTVPAAQYLRMSTEHQQYSLDHQSEAIQGYAKWHGFEIVQTYSDAGRSGIRLENRPELIRLLNDVVSGNATFRAVLVYDVSRWGRFQDCDEAAHYEFICKRAGVRVHYCAESFTNDDTLPSSIFKALKRTMAAEYSREMGGRCFAAARRLVALGFKQGGAPGYGMRRLMISADGQRKKVLSTGEVKSLRTDRVVLVPGPDEEIMVVREIYRLVIDENRTPYFVAGELNRRGVNSPEGKWRVAHVSRILTDPKYAGYNVWNRTSRRLGRPRVTVPKSNWLLQPRAFEPVVDPEVFEHAQRVLAEQRRPYSNEELLESLRQLLTAKGTLSYRVIEASPNLASVNTFIRRFGTLRRAFELAGHEYPWTAISHDYERQTKRFHDELLHQIKTLFPREVAIFRPDPEAWECLHVCGAFTVSLVVCPAIRRNRCISWVADSRRTERKTVTLLARLTADNTWFRDFYVMPTPGRHWIRHRGELKNGQQLLDLSDFCSVVQAVASQQ